MSASASRQNPSDFSKTSWLFSATIHLLGAMFLFNSQAFRAAFRLPDLKKKQTEEKSQSYVQVDMVALPDELLRSLPSLDVTKPIVEKPNIQKEEPKIEPKKEEVLPTLPSKPLETPRPPLPKLDREKQKREADEAERLEREKALKKALDALQAEKEREAALKGLQEQAGKEGRKKIAGNKLSKGTSNTGVVGTARDQYYDVLRQAIRNRFAVYPWLKKKKIRTTVYLELYPNGRVKLKMISQSSKEPAFDSAVLEAIQLAEPLPIPEDLNLISSGFNLNFTPE